MRTQAAPSTGQPPRLPAALTVGRGGEDEGLAAVDADVAQVVEQRVVGGAAVAQGHQLLQNRARPLRALRGCRRSPVSLPGLWLQASWGVGAGALHRDEAGLVRAHRDCRGPAPGACCPGHPLPRRGSAVAALPAGMTLATATTAQPATVLHGLCQARDPLQPHSSSQPPAGTLLHTSPCDRRADRLRKTETQLGNGAAGI